MTWASLRKDRVASANRDPAERGDDLAVELFEAEKNVGFVHRLEVEVGADDAVGVDDHAGPCWRGRQACPRSGSPVALSRGGGQAVEAADDEG